MARYNIKNNEITVVKCKTCGHEIDVSNLWLVDVNGLREYGMNSLLVCDRLADCCEKPDYTHVRD